MRRAGPASAGMVAVVLMLGAMAPAAALPSDPVADSDPGDVAPTVVDFPLVLSDDAAAALADVERAEHDHAHHHGHHHDLSQLALPLVSAALYHQDDQEEAVEPLVVEGVLAEQPVEEVEAAELTEGVVLGTVDEELRVATPAVVLDEPFQTLGITWPLDAGHAPLLMARVRALDGTWGPWFELKDDGKVSDDGSLEDVEGVRAGSDPWFVGESDAFQLATNAAIPATALQDIAVSAVASPLVGTPFDDVEDAHGSADGFTSTREEFGEPGPEPEETAARAPFGRSASTPLALATTTAPAIVPRSQWGAAAATCAMSAAPTLRAAVVHHTAGTNAVPNAATARQHVRNIQAFHQSSRGWCDIGYNFLIDPFGNIIEGRAGSLDRAIVGVHAGGFNTGTVGIAALGDFTSVAMTNATVEAFGRIIGWRLGVSGVNPAGSQQWTFTSGANSRFRPGEVVTLPNVMGHRDVSHTACPGNIGHTQMTAIRQAAQRNIGSVAATPPPLGTITFSGRGWGHGRGMGQWGALGYAVDHGWSAEQILRHFYGGTTLARDAGNPQVSVELMAHSGREVRVRAADLRVNGVSQGNVTVRLVRNGDRLDWFTGNACNATSWTPRGTLTGTVQLTAADTSDPARMLRVCDPGFGSAGAGTVYRGRIDVLVRNNTQFAVNVLPVQEYLQGVVPREMPALWGNQGGGRGAQALQAQATAARSFALSGAGSPRTSTAITCDTTACQAYGGFGTFNAAGTWTAGEHTLTNAAVAATHGWVMRRANGTIARTEYSASTGGWTAGGDFPAVVDAGDGITSNPNRTWTASFTPAQLGTALGLSNITSIAVTQRNGHGADGGRATQVTIVAGGVTHTRTGAQVRAALGLRSDWFTIQGGGAAANRAPVSALDIVEPVAGGVRVRGWTFDPDTEASINVHFRVDGVLVRGLTANGSRPDVGRHFGRGANHGFDVTLPAETGNRQVCVHAINVPAGTNPLIGCRTVPVRNAAPVGHLDAVTGAPGEIRVAGWAFDPDAPESVTVQVLVDGRLELSARTATARPDVTRAVGAHGLSGFVHTLPSTFGNRQVCIQALDASTGRAQSLGCRNVQVPNTLVTGALTATSAQTAAARGNQSPLPSTVTASGWAWDRNISGPVTVQLQVDGQVRAQGTANETRSPVPSGAGRGTVGFTLTAEAPPGDRQVCVVAIDANTAERRQLGCQNVTVENAAPQGVIDQIVGSTGQIRVRGWALDPDSREPISIHVIMDGQLAGHVRASGSRPDVDRVFGLGESRGFDITVSAASGTRSVCVHMINTPVNHNANPAINGRCHAVVVP